MRSSCLVPPLLLLSFGLQAPAQTPTPPAAPATEPSTEPVPGFTRDGRVRDPNWFPLAVWLQDPANAANYRALGVNLYVGLWDGPTKAQLDALAAAGMPVICHHNDVAAAHGGTTIVAWMHNDEPDNAQGRRLRGYAPLIAPAKVVADYQALRERDAARPVFLNLGQGAAWDGWHGRGERSGHPEDYPEYLQGCDIGCFDIYPVTHPHRDVQGKLEFVGRGVRGCGAGPATGSRSGPASRPATSAMRRCGLRPNRSATKRGWRSRAGRRAWCGSATSSSRSSRKRACCGTPRWRRWCARCRRSCAPWRRC